MKTLEELRDTIELGFVVYSHTFPQLEVYRDWGKGPGRNEAVYMIADPLAYAGMGYETLDALIADATTPEVTACVWSTLAVSVTHE